MLKFRVTDDHQWMLLLEALDEVEKKQVEISLTQKIHNHFFHPLVKKKIWDGSICFIEKKGGFWKVPIGLWRELLDIGEKYKIQINIEGLNNVITNDIKLEDFTQWVMEFFEGGIGGNPEKMPRDYQIETAWKILRYRYSVSEVATSSGKTLISFMIFAYLKSKGLARKILMIVPNSNLVFQGNDDFEEYGLDKLDGVKIQQIGGGSKMKDGCDIIIGTYQSLVKRESDFFEEVDCVFIDEAHHTNSTSIKKIVSQCMHSKWRFGLTGTLTKKGTADYLTIQQFLGPLVMEIPPSFLFDNGYATPVSIKIVTMDWLDPVYKEKLADLKLSDNNVEGNEIYNLERKLVIESKVRLNYVTDFINKTSKNSLVLFQSVKEEYGKQIWNLLRELNGDREVFYVDGDTSEALREEYKRRMSIGSNKVLIATYGTFSTGISINNLHNIFLVESYKSEILIKQSLGRGMRKMEGKEKVNVIDFVDDFSTRKYKSYLAKHSLERIEIYKKEGFEYKIYNVKL